MMLMWLVHICMYTIIEAKQSKKTTPGLFENTSEGLFQLESSQDSVVAQCDVAVRKQPAIYVSMFLGGSVV